MKIIIVDDEKLIRHSICCHLAELGFKDEDIDEAENGEIFLKKLSHYPYDIALVDVKMPILSGLDAIRQGRLISPDTLFYILSGFDEFKYAQEAIRMGVKDYLLKPIRRNDLEQTVETAIVSTEQKRSAFRRNLKMMITEMLEDPSNDILFPISGRAFLLTPDVLQEQPVLTHESFSLTDKLLFIERKHPSLNGTLVFLFTESEFSTDTSQTLQPFLLYLLEFSTVYEYAAFKSSKAFYIEDQRIRSLIPQRFLTGIRKFYKKGTRPLAIPEKYIHLSEIASSLLQCYQNKKYSEFVLYSKELASSEALSETSALTEHFLTSFQLLFNVRDLSIEKELEKYSRDLILSLNNRESIAKHAAAYIKDHYKEDISINFMANMYSITPNYFSNLFHKETGKTFIQYLTAVRIQEGKRLIIETNLTINEITEQIGYYSSSYFIKRFLQSEGMTPAEYRKHHSLL